MVMQKIARNNMHVPTWTCPCLQDEELVDRQVQKLSELRKEQQRGQSQTNIIQVCIKQSSITHGTGHIPSYKARLSNRGGAAVVT
jgi:hypothetical protein